MPDTPAIDIRACCDERGDTMRMTVCEAKIRKMSKIDRRNILRAGLASVALPGAAMLNFGCTPGAEKEAVTGETSDEPPQVTDEQPQVTDNNVEKDNAMKIQYLEIVTADVDAACTLYSQMHGVTFGEADPSLGGARVAKLDGGGMLGIRAPMRATENPVVRPYVLVEDIKASVAAAAAAGGDIAMPPTPIPGHGQFAIVIHGGIDSGLWQL